MLMGLAVHYRATSSPSSSSCLCPVHRLAHVAPTSSRPSRQVMSRKPLGILLTLLESPLVGVLVSVDSKGLTDMLTPLVCNTYKKPGEGAPPGAPPRFLHLHPSYLRGNSHFAFSQGTAEIISSPCVQGAYSGLE